MRENIVKAFFNVINWDAVAKKYADAEIARLIKENKKGYSYTLGRNSKGEIIVNITEKK